MLDTFDPLAVSSSSEPLMPSAGVSGVGSWAMADCVILDMPEASGCSLGSPDHSSLEPRVMWNWMKVFTKLGTKDLCIKFAEERGLIPKQMKCSYHRSLMNLRSDHGLVGQFRCLKSVCRTKDVSRAKGTWFENVNLALPVTFRVMYAFCRGLSYQQTQHEVHEDDKKILPNNTIANCFSYCIETIIVYELEHQEVGRKIGGPNKIVYINECKIGKKEYIRGRQIEGHWVIGMIEDECDDLRLEVFPDNEKTAEILVPLIKKHVQEGSIIQTDDCKSYMSLSEHGYIHKRVKKSDLIYKLVAPKRTDTLIYDSQCRGFIYKNRQNNKKDYSDWLYEYSWRRKNHIHKRDPFEELIKCINYVYPSKLCSY